VSRQAPILLVVALEVERRALSRRLAGRVREAGTGPPAVAGTLAGQPVIVVQAGLGAERARDAALHAARRAGCASLWSMGLAGGLDRARRPGDLLLPDTVLSSSARAYSCPLAAGLRLALSGAAAHGGVLASVAAPVLTPADKLALFTAAGAVAADMEAAGIAEAAAALGVSWLAVKAVLDPADRAVPPFLLAGTGPDGALRPWALAAAACSPGRLRAILEFARLSRRALAGLGQGAEALVRAWARLDAIRAVQ
jgi:nucleoside phosphorylase